MTSILTNTAAMAALQTLRSVGGQLSNTQTQVSSGLRVQTASDNAAYWSIATTMRSDSKAISAVSDALGLGAAKVDTAYTGLENTLDIMSQIKAKLVTATEPSVDKSKIQQELDQLKQQVIGIATSSSFNGQNLLDTSVPDIYDIDNNSDSIISSFTRDASGGVAVSSSDIHLSTTSLFNSTGGGLLQRDARDMSTLGGMRYLATSTVDGKTTQQWVPANAYGSQANFEFNFSGPITFADPSDQMSFDVTVDKDNPADGIDPPYDPGKTTAITIDRSTVDAVNSSWNGKVSTFTQYEQVLNYALSQANASAYVGSVSDGKGGIVPNVIDFATKQDRSTGLNGSYVEVSNFTSSVASGGLSNNSDQGARGSALNLDFTSFQDFRDGDDADGLTVDFSFAVNNQPPKQYTFDRTYVNNVLGVDNGKIETSDQMVTVLRSLLSSDWPTLQIDASSVSSVTLKTDPALDRRAGSDTGIHFSNIDVSNEPIPTINFMDIDIDKNPDMVSDYLTYIEAASQRITSGAAQLGDIQKRIDQQTSFTQTLMDDIDSGVGKLTDADMEEESSKLAAQQTQQQLAVQALSIANSSPQTILSLFQQ